MMYEERGVQYNSDYVAYLKNRVKVLKKKEKQLKRLMIASSVKREKAAASFFKKEYKNVKDRKKNLKLELFFASDIFGERGI